MFCSCQQSRRMTGLNVCVFLPSHSGDCWDNRSWTRLHQAEIFWKLHFIGVFSELFFFVVKCEFVTSAFVLQTELKKTLNLKFSVRLWLFSSGISHPSEKRRRSHQCRRTWGIQERNWSRSSLSLLHAERVLVQDLSQNHDSFQPQGKKVFCLIT